ncbi:MAG: 30S ribosomal protein S6, partial [Verrucomicrobia bacterium]|nr:30S ribosomal protein S6 [Verrucomicrobiota bacterium]
MSRKYQGLIVLNTKSLEGSVDDLVASISKEIEAEGVKLDKISQLGRRQFAYESRHLESGHYVNYTFAGSP